MFIILLPLYTYFLRQRNYVISELLLILQFFVITANIKLLKKLRIELLFRLYGTCKLRLENDDNYWYTNIAYTS